MLVKKNKTIIDSTNRYAIKEIIMKYYLPLHFYIGNNVNTDKIVL